MSDTPLASLVLAELTPKHLREIDHEYHVEMIAKNSKELVDYHKDLLCAQAESAALNLLGQQQIARRQDETNCYLSALEQDCRAMVEGIDRLNDTVSDGFAAMNHVLSAGFGAVVEGLERISEQMMMQQRTLNDIAETLRRPYGAKVKELLMNATKWLREGMKTTGRDRDENWKDAARLLRTVTENPLGMQNYVVWFQMGWLLWKHEENIAEAEEAFERAQRLSASDGSPYYLKSLRHLAYMQYLQDKHEDAYKTIQKALMVSRDHASLFDAARYAARTGREKEYLSLLDQCIELEPTTIFRMFSEADFQ